MADLRGEHNASPQVGVVPNNDPALNVANEHTHGHLHHSERVASVSDNIVYSKGTTNNADNFIKPKEGLYDSHPGRTEGDLEKGDLKPGLVVHDTDRSSNSHQGVEKNEHGGKFSAFYAKWRLLFHGFFLLLFTVWWIVGLILHHDDKNWIKPFLFWLAITLRIITLHVPLAGWVMKVLRFLWVNTGVRVKDVIPVKMRTPSAAFLVLAVIIVGAFASEETADNTRANRAVSLFGILVFIGLLYATSRNRSKIVWHTVIVGFLMQFIVALFVLRTQAGFDIFDFISEMARDLLGFAKEGLAFLTDVETTQIGWFLISVLPAIIFFVAFVQMLFYWGTLQWFIGKFATFFFWSMRVSGAEAVVASASPFIGQGESAMLIKPFVAHLTMAELHQIMTSGFATIAGSVLVAYLGMGISGQALISSCVMSIPASLAMSKLRYPEEEETLTSGRVVIPDDDEHRAANVLHAFADGAWIGIKIAGTIAATLLCIIALVALIDGLLTWWGRYLNLQGEYDLTLQLILGYLCYPIAFLLGVSRDRDGADLLRVGRLIGTKVVVNEFVAYIDLTTDPYYAELSNRSRLIATYALCGFGNIGSLGTQIGLLSQIAPTRAGDVSRLAISALLTGILSTLSSAGIAGMVVTNEAAYVTPPAM